MQQPWIAKWGRGEPLDGGGQGDTLLVPSRDKPEGVLKVLKSYKKSDEKARRRMFQEVSNLKILNAAGANVPRVLDDNVGEFVNAETELFFVHAIPIMVNGHLLTHKFEHGV